MKTNKIMRFAIAVVMLVLVSTCAISGTFAKYTTQGSAKDTATVAKWGVNVKFESAASNAVLDTDSSTEEDVKVSAAAENQIIAPGTKIDDIISFSVKGNPEVSARVSYTAEVTLNNWTISSGFYCPLEITVTVNGQEKVFNTTTYTTAALLEEAIENEITGLSGQYLVSNGDIDINDIVSIDISWAFDGDDTKDTELGNLETLPTISFSISATITQIN